MSEYKLTDKGTPRYIGSLFADISKSDGGLPHIIGASHYQVLRANRARPDEADGIGFTYNHAPDISFWNDRFWVQYISNRVDEHEPGGLSFISYSYDGIKWSKPAVSFPRLLLPQGENKCSDGTTVNIPENEYAVMHQRTAFYNAPNGRLLTTGFYGYSPDHAVPWEHNGLGRVVREIFNDGSLGPIFFIYIMRKSGWKTESLPFQEYTACNDPGFIEACNSLLSDRFETQQWAEEHGNDCEYIALKTHNEVFGEIKNRPYQAFARYHINDNTVVALWKHSVVGISFDNGDNWLIKRETSFATSGAKAWGQKTSDDRFALFYINSLSSEHRYPLVCLTSDDGIDFDGMATVFGETPPRRYEGLYKDYGPQYIRGIGESCKEKPAGAVWITYSVNKEDIWVSRIPVPISVCAERYFKGSFKNNKYLEPWNIYSSRWAYIENVDDEMVITDRDPVDYAVAELNFPECVCIRVSIDISCEKYDQALEIELTDRNGNVCSRLYIEKGFLFGRYTSVKNLLSEFSAGTHTLIIEQDCHKCDYAIYLDGEKKSILRDMQKINLVSRLVLRTKPKRNAPGIDNRPLTPDIPDADISVSPRVYRILSVTTEKLNNTAIK